MHGRGCSHDMGAGRNFWVSGRSVPRKRVQKTVTCRCDEQDTTREPDTKRPNNGRRPLTNTRESTSDRPRTRQGEALCSSTPVVHHEAIVIQPFLDFSAAVRST